MWETLFRAPRGSYSQRKFSHVLVTFLVAVFGYLFATTPTAFAADEATWDGDLITFEGKNFQRIENSEAPAEFQGSAGIYRGLDPLQGTIPVRVYFIYFSSTADDIKAEKEATYKVYLSTSLSPPYQLQEPAAETRTISVGSPEGESGEGDGEDATSCAVENVGWIVCSLGNWIASGIDIVYDAMKTFLTVQELTSNGSSSLYKLWDVIRNFANICFVIGFLVVIYSYLAGGGFNGYEIRKIIPRIVVAAILINISFWICSLAVDLSNIIGISLQDLLMNIRDTAVVDPDNPNVNVGWGELTAYIFSGGAIGGLAFLAATGGSIASFGFLLLGVLIIVVFALFVAFIILAARQAIIIILIVLSPLAFAAFILPNTEKWFDRWRSTFTTLLVLFPIFSLLFGGSQLAGAAIIQNANNLAIMLFGLAVQVVPLVITPLLIQFSGSLLGRIAGIVNNPGKGVVDRSRNWTKDRQELHRQKNLAQPNTKYNRLNIARRGAQRMYAKDAARKQRLEAYKEGAENLAHEREFGTGWVAQSRLGRKAGLPERMNKASYGYWDEQYRDEKLAHQRIEAQHEKHWKERSNISITDPNDPTRRIANPHFDQNQFDQRVALQYAQDRGQLADDRMTTAYTVMKAGRNPYEASGMASMSNQELDSQIDAVRATARDITIEANRKGSAEVVIQQAGAAALKESLDLRQVAGGIGGEAAANRIYAKAKVDVVGAYMDDVKNSRSVLSDYTAKQLVRLHVEGIDRDGKQIYNPITGEGNTAIVDAAMQEIALNKGNNWAMQKMRDRVADTGMIYEYDETTNESKYFDLQRDSSGAVIRDKITGRARKGAEITDQSIIDRRRDVQQLFADAAKQSKLRVANLSQTDLGNYESGVSTTSGQEAIIRDIITGKFDQAKIVDLDVDELQRMVQVVRQPEVRDYINSEKSEALGKLMANIDGAQANKQINGRIKDRERGIMNAIASYIDPNEASRRAVTDGTGRSDVEIHYYVDPANDNVRVPASTPGAVSQEAVVRAPKDYDPLTQQ